jgi:hypothetical protein
MFEENNSLASEATSEQNQNTARLEAGAGFGGVDGLAGLMGKLEF